LRAKADQSREQKEIRVDNRSGWRKTMKMSVQKKRQQGR
jgi:hypothetical protein